jgi:lauroyl/myristoyl acyltransferase
VSDRIDDDSRTPRLASRLILRAALAAGSRIPPKAARFLATVPAEVEYRLSPRRRAAVLDNLAAIGGSGHPALDSPDSRERVAREVFRSYHRFVVEFFAQARWTRRAWNRGFRFHGMEVLYRALAAGHGAVIAAPHLGNWELGGLALARLGFRVHVVTGVQLNPLLHAAVRALKESSGIAVSTPEDGFVPLLDTLKQGGLVVLLVDGDVYSRGLTTRFFGRRVPFPAGPALLARRAGAPLLHAHAVRSRDGHLVSFDGCVLPDSALPLDRDLARLTDSVAQAQERNIANHVAQWCIFRPFFRAGRTGENGEPGQSGQPEVEAGAA